MNRPPPLGRIFAVYFRALLIAALFVMAFALALRLGWPLPPLIPEPLP